MASISAGSKRALSIRSQGSSSKPRPAGLLTQLDSNGRATIAKQVIPGRDLIIGRDQHKCQLFLDDPYVSARHLRIYTVVYDDNDSTEVDSLVYAEDLSRNGTYWNGTLIGRGNHGFLLSDGDVLKLSINVSLKFTRSSPLDNAMPFDLVQENEMDKFVSSYIVTDRLLGSGAFGRVFMAVEQMTRTQLACKIVDLRKLRPSMTFGRAEDPMPAASVDVNTQLRKVKEWSDKQKRENKFDEKLKTYYREAEILASIRHPNIIGIEKVFVTDNTIYIFQELVTGGDLFSYIELKNGKLSEVEAAVVIRQIVVALAFLHEKNIVHRDLKPDNILMTSTATGCRVILTDFGAARRISTPFQRMVSLAGTDEYIAPEVASDASNTSRKGYTRAVDMWSLGCVSAVLLTGASAFADPVTRIYSETLAKQCNQESLRLSQEWQAVRERPRDFVEKLLVIDEAKRMTAPDALRHSWFANDFHRPDFEALYDRAMRHWRPRATGRDLFEFAGPSIARKIARNEGVLPEKRRRDSSPRPHQILDSHYKPFPRQMHKPIWPERHPDGYNAVARATLEQSWVAPSVEFQHYESSSEDELSRARSKRRRTLSTGSTSGTGTPRSRRSGLALTTAQKRLAKKAARRTPVPLTESGFPRNEPSQLQSASPKPPLTPNLRHRTPFKIAVPLRPADPNIQRTGDPTKRKVSIQPTTTVKAVQIVTTTNSTVGLISDGFQEGDVGVVGPGLHPPTTNNTATFTQRTPPAAQQGTAIEHSTSGKLQRRSASSLSSTRTATPSETPSKRLRGSIFDLEDSTENRVSWRSMRYRKSATTSPSKLARLGDDDVVVAHHDSIAVSYEARSP